MRRCSDIRNRRPRVSPEDDLEPPLATVDKAIDVLFELHTAGSSVGVTALGRALGLPKSSTHRLLSALRRRGLVERDERGRYLPGIGLSWNAPGFAFLNTDFTLYIDDSSNVDLAEDDGWMIDVNWARPFGGGKWSVEGHAEYISERTNFFGTVEAWILAQPQVRYYVSDNVAIGIEYQYWMNKLGDDATDESTVQALLVWKF